MHKKTYPARVEDGHVYATVTLRDVIERTDVNGLPFLEEYRRLYEENDRLRELLTFYLGCLTKGHVNCESCAFRDKDWCDHGRRVIEKARELGIEGA